MKKTTLRAALPRTIGATVLASGLLVLACTTEAPVASDESTGLDPAASVQERNQRVADVWVEPDGRVYINDQLHPMEDVSDVIAALDADSEGYLAVAIAGDAAVPYGVMAALQREIQESGALRVAFGVTSTRPAPTPQGDPSDVISGLPLVLPEEGAPVPQQVSMRNLLHLIVQPSGVVDVKRGESSIIERRRATDVERIWRADVARNPNLIAAVAVHPDADYAHMVDVLDALQAAEALRISIQELEL